MRYLNKEFSDAATIPEKLHSYFLNKGSEILTNCGHSNSNYGMEQIWSVWKRNKGWMWNLFSRSRYWNGKGQIVISHDFPRSIDKGEMRDFFSWVQNTLRSRMYSHTVTICGMTYDDVDRYLHQTKRKIAAIESTKMFVPIGVYLENQLSLLREDKARFEVLHATIDEKVEYYGGDYYEKEYVNRFTHFREFVYRFTLKEHSRLASEEVANLVNEFYPEIKAVAGQKTSRIIGKLMRYLGMETEDEYNRRFTRFADAINPLVIRRHTILSIHPFDFWTMSWGNSWNSCHDIDLNEYYHSDETDYHGCYCSGTTSYMLDGVSFVFYTVDASYEGDCFEMEPKVNRCMFHIDKDKIVQGRLYPQANDVGAEETYREIREVVQRLICEAADAVNDWKKVGGTSECRKVINSFGTNYADYFHFNNCNVSYWKGNGELNEEKINVGHNPICPDCGEEHHEQDHLCCEVCNGDGYVCAECGRTIDYDDVYWINGEPYCYDCTFYCDYHEERETGEYYHVPGYGKVCENAVLNSGDFVEIEDPMYRGENYMYFEDVHETEDGRFFRTVEHMMEAGYDEDGHKIESEAGERRCIKPGTTH